MDGVTRVDEGRARDTLRCFETAWTRDTTDIWTMIFRRFDEKGAEIYARFSRDGKLRQCPPLLNPSVKIRGIEDSFVVACSRDTNENSSLESSLDALHDLSLVFLFNVVP